MMYLMQKRILMSKIKELIIASNNSHKIEEIKQILGDYFDNIYSLADKEINVEIEETGSTFEENSLIKAKYIAELTGIPALSDDSGLEVNALGGAPGVYSARYSGEGASAESNNAKLLKAMKWRFNRQANFTCVITICYPDGKHITAKGKTYGKILRKPCGTNGFGYDPLFFSDELNKSFGNSTSEEKNAVSHRAKALQQMKELLEKNI